MHVVSGSAALDEANYLPGGVFDLRSDFLAMDSLITRALEVPPIIHGPSGSLSEALRNDPMFPGGLYKACGILELLEGIVDFPAMARHGLSSRRYGHGIWRETDILLDPRKIRQLRSEERTSYHIRNSLLRFSRYVDPDSIDAKRISEYMKFSPVCPVDTCYDFPGYLVLPVPDSFDDSAFSFSTRNLWESIFHNKEDLLQMYDNSYPPSFTVQESIGTTIINPKVSSVFNEKKASDEILRRPVPGRNGFDLVSIYDGISDAKIIIQGGYRPSQEVGRFDGDLLQISYKYEDEILHSTTCPRSLARAAVTPLLDTEGPGLSEVIDDNFWKIYIDDLGRLLTVTKVHMD